MHPEAEAAASIDIEPAQEAEAPWFEQHFDGGGEALGEPYVEPASAAPYRKVVGGFLVALAVLWLGSVAWAAGQASTVVAFGGVDLVRWTAIASAPLALIGLGWLLIGRSSRGETARFIRDVQQMRAESEALQAVLHNIGAQVAANRAALADESVRFANLGAETAERLGAVTRDVDAGTQAMARYAEQLDRAAGSARTDIGVLLADLPRADAQARGMADALRAAGVDAQASADALETRMETLAIRAREADESAGGAAAGLTAHIAQVEAAARTAAADMDAATAAMAAGVDAATARAAEALETTRAGVAEQGAAVLAMVDRAGASFDSAGAATSANLEARLAEISLRLDRLAEQVAAQDAAARTVAETLDASLGGMEARLPALTADGEARLGVLGATLDHVRGLLDGVLLSMHGGDARIGEMTAQGEALRLVLADVEDTLARSLPVGLADIETRAERGRSATEALLPQVAALEQAADAARDRLDDAGARAAARLADAEQLVARQGGALDELVAQQAGALDAVLGKLDAGLSVAREQAAALGGVASETDASAERLVRETGPQLIEALLRVREAALQATERAREAIATAIPDAAARLGDATGAAMQAAITDRVSGQMTELGALTERAVEAARSASERLTRQMISIGETAAAVETHIHEAQESLRESDNEHFSRRVATLIESLNSTAIDVAKILSNEVTDNAWAQYLKGDRGVFTRRAVRLLDGGEAREIARHYEEEPEFRDQVNRYIHDFEALLRRVLAERDGSPLGVTLLSSDMGKLYVALAQAIERIRG